MVPFGAQNLILVAYPSVISRGPRKGSTNGYIVYYLDVSTDDPPVELNPVLPESGDEHESFIAFLTMVPDGRGSALLYWYDVDARSDPVGRTGQVKIRGRHVSPRFQTYDFDLSRTAGVGRSWSYTDTGWYGDYHEAGGYSGLLPRPPFGRNPILRHIYFPAWADAHGETHTVQVIVDEPGAGQPIDTTSAQSRN
jgi:hypothetical protein